MEKKKKLSAPRLSSLPFMLIWIGGHVLTWLVLYGISEMRFFWDWPEFVMLVLFGLILGVGLSLMQKGLIRFTFHVPLRWWLRATVGGWILGWIAFYYYFEWLERYLNFDGNLSLMLLPLFVIPALMQWLVLRRNARDGWLWIVAGAVSAMAFGALYGDLNRNEMLQFALGAAAQGAVTGLSLLWLFGQTRTEKIKTDITS